MVAGIIAYQRNSYRRIKDVTTGEKQANVFRYVHIKFIKKKAMVLLFSFLFILILL